MGKNLQAKPSKELVTYRLPPVLIQKVDAVAKELHWTKAAVLEELIKRFGSELISHEAIRITETAAKYRTDAEERKQGGTK